MKGKTPRADMRVVLVASPTHALRKKWGQGLRGFVIHEADRRPALERSMALVRPAVVFIDLDLPGLGGLGGVPSIQRLNPAAKIILLASAPNERQAVFALVAGARGYCGRNIGPALIRKATEVVQRGEIWIARRVVPLLLRRLTSLAFDQQYTSRTGPDSPFDSLPDREREVAELVSIGANNKEIATRLSITEGTVKAHLTSVFRKLNVSDRLRLALFVTERKSQLHAPAAPRPTKVQLTPAPGRGR